jgi:Asp/Glu/hydantoin racemase
VTSAGLLHTVPALADTFQRRLGETDPGLTLTHLADPSLLARAIATGVDEQVHERVLAHVRHLVATGAEAVLVTCSSIGEAAEAAARSVDVPVVRVDQAMAERAVEIAAAAQGRVAVVATLESTLGPTERLLRRLAADLDGVTIRSAVVAGAADARAAGDLSEHDRLVRAEVGRAADEADVVVLAQASMAAALSGGPGEPRALDVPVLESVSTGLERLSRTLRDPVRGEFRGKC